MTEVVNLRELCSALTQVLGCLAVDLADSGFPKAAKDLDKLTEFCFEAASGKCQAGLIDKILPWTHHVNTGEE